ncbi:hypothetical protein BKA82DRAFT_992965 [Pisolithus tinctorius]|uniref:Uncharacterized protein n=1 Tax=Pisolithus tinctorius Marx 270 TaxID=870435 RepID=A0A0C3PVU7_PISTI|nr:hypothetical protein BKA82DRAFT_992965 [Pisolithus tinctorius]KIO13406.1 hypothetical protein M404DRAFT_992965 [Pisolithus tinctorius Marx 270]
MVKLSLISPKGNQGVRYFPHHGYLGLTPVKVEGLVRTNVEQDGKPVLAKDVTVAVRCYEARHGRFGAVHLNVLSEHVLTLWHKDDNQDWSEIRDSEYPFRLSVPSNVAAPSVALYSQEYRIFWRVEAVLNHVPIAGVGSRQVKYFELPLIRYNLPIHSSPSILAPSPWHTTHLSTSRSRGVPLRYCILVPPNPIGPLDIVTIQLTVQPPDQSVSIRSASALVERRIYFSEIPSISHPSTESIPASSFSNCSPELYAGVGASSQNLHAASSSSLYSDCPSRPLLQDHPRTPDEAPSFPPSDRAITHIFAHSESSAHFVRVADGIWKQNLTFSWPETKSNSRWSVGETMQTEMATVKFFLRVKLIVSSPSCSAETVELDNRELAVVSTNDSQRQTALARYNESGRHKSKSPRSSNRERRAEHADQLPSPQASSNSSQEGPFSAPPRHPSDSRLGHTYKFSSASDPHAQNDNHKAKRSRRPHTSAGPRDKPDGFVMRSYEPVPSQTSSVSTGARSSTLVTPTSRSCWRQKWPEVPRLGSRSSSNPDGHDNSKGISQRDQGGRLHEHMDQVEIRAWEEEPVRIELANQKKSTANVLGFISQRKRSSGILSAIRTVLPTGG